MQHNAKYAHEELGKHGLSVTVRMHHNMSDNQKKDEMDRAIRLFKKRLNDEGWQNDIRRKEYYQSPGELRRKAKADATLRSLRQARLNDPDYVKPVQKPRKQRKPRDTSIIEIKE